MDKALKDKIALRIPVPCEDCGRRDSFGMLPLDCQESRKTGTEKPCHWQNTVAEAILALLPPMLTKDEARCINIQSSCDGCSAVDSLVKCNKILDRVEAKLKAIQEEE